MSNQKLSEIFFNANLPQTYILFLDRNSNGICCCALGYLFLQKNPSWIDKSKDEIDNLRIQPYLIKEPYPALNDVFDVDNLIEKILSFLSPEQSKAFLRVPLNNCRKINLFQLIANLNDDARFTFHEIGLVLQHLGY